MRADTRQKSARQETKLAAGPYALGGGVSRYSCTSALNPFAAPVHLQGVADDTAVGELEDRRFVDGYHTFEAFMPITCCTAPVASQAAAAADTA